MLPLSRATSCAERRRPPATAVSSTRAPVVRLVRILRQLKLRSHRATRRDKAVQSRRAGRCELGILQCRIPEVYCVRTNFFAHTCHHCINRRVRRLRCELDKILFCFLSLQKISSIWGGLCSQIFCSGFAMDSTRGLLYSTLCRFRACNYYALIDVHDDPICNRPAYNVVTHVLYF